MNSKMLAYRIRILPEQLERARNRYIMLCREANRLGMVECLNESERKMVNG